MNRDLLDEAAKALRARGDAPGGAPEPAFAEIVSDVRRSTRRRRTMHVVGAPLGVLLFGFGAWAAGSGRLARIVDGFNEAPASPPTEKPRVRSGRRPTATPPAAEQPQVTPEPQVPALAEEPAAAPLVAPPPIRPRPARRQIEPAHVAPAPDMLYRKAHEAHFVHKRWDEAVTLWDAYLATHDLRFAVEARFNRALALVRLDRKHEAVEALQPFARGDYGSYRQQDAQRIVGWLTRPAP